jgi:CRP-like cAMP-binding protein
MDSAAPVLSLLTAVHPLPEEAQAAFLSALRPVQFAKKEVMTSPGQVQRDMLIITEGVQYSYIIKEGKLHVLAFTYPVQVSGIPESFFTQSPSECWLEALTPTKGFAISHEALQGLYEQHRSLETLNRLMLQGVLIGLIKRQMEMLSSSAEERFRAFAARSPHLFQLVPHKLIASYLRIDATNFSRFFNEIRI